MPSVEKALNAVKHLLWCGEDQGLPLQRDHCEEVCTAFLCAEQQVTKATSLIDKFNSGVGPLIDLLCTTGRAIVTTEAERSRVLSLLQPGFSPDVESGPHLPRPPVREYVGKASGGVKGHKHQLFVRSGPDTFRIATSAGSPA